MADEQPQDTTVTTGDGTGPNAGNDEQKKGGDPKASKTFTEDQVNDIVKERLERAQQRAAQAEAKARAEAEQKVLQEQGEFKKLAEKQAGRIVELEAVEATAKDQAATIERLTAALTQYRDAQIKGVSPAIRDLLEKQDIVAQLEWLSKNATQGKTQPPHTTASGGGKGNDEAAKAERAEELKRRFRI